MYKIWSMKSISNKNVDFNLPAYRRTPFYLEHIVNKNQNNFIVNYPYINGYEYLLESWRSLSNSSFIYLCIKRSRFSWVLKSSLAPTTNQDNSFFRLKATETVPEMNMYSNYDKYIDDNMKFMVNNYFVLVKDMLHYLPKDVAFIPARGVEDSTERPL